MAAGDSGFWWHASRPDGPEVTVEVTPDFDEEVHRDEIAAGRAFPEAVISAVSLRSLTWPNYATFWRDVASTKEGHAFSEQRWHDALKQMGASEIDVQHVENIGAEACGGHNPAGGELALWVRGRRGERVTRRVAVVGANEIDAEALRELRLQVQEDEELLVNEKRAVTDVLESWEKNVSTASGWLVLWQPDGPEGPFILEPVHDNEEINEGVDQGYIVPGTVLSALRARFTELRWPSYAAFCRDVASTEEGHAFSEQRWEEVQNCLRDKRQFVKDDIHITVGYDKTSGALELWVRGRWRASVTRHVAEYYPMGVDEAAPKAIRGLSTQVRGDESLSSRERAVVLEALDQWQSQGFVSTPEPTPTTAGTAATPIQPAAWWVLDAASGRLVPAPTNDNIELRAARREVYAYALLVKAFPSFAQTRELPSGTSMWSLWAALAPHDRDNARWLGFATASVCPVMKGERPGRGPAPRPGFRRGLRAVAVSGTSIPLVLGLNERTSNLELWVSPTRDQLARLIALGPTLAALREDLEKVSWSMFGEPERAAAQGMINEWAEACREVLPADTAPPPATDPLPASATNQFPSNESATAQENAVYKNDDDTTPTTHPTADLFFAGGKRAGKMLLSVQAMALVQSLVRKIAAKHLLTPEQAALLDTPGGQILIDILSPLILHAMAVQNAFGASASPYVETTAALAYEGQLVKHGIQLTEQLANLTTEFATEFAQIKALGQSIAESEGERAARTPVVEVVR